ncbi:MAG: response regulator [Phycisphaerales bacterium]|nr:response regulator [Phycisphaerales bacterium]
MNRRAHSPGATPRWPGFAVVVALCGGLVILGFATWIGLQARPRNDADVAGSSAFAMLNDMGRGLQADVLRVVRPVRARTEAIAADPRTVEIMRRGDAAELTELANDCVRNAIDVDAVALFDANGNITAINTIYTSGDTIDAGRITRVLSMSSDREIIRSCLRNDAAGPVMEFQTDCDITPALFDSRGLSVACSVPVIDPDTGARLGVVSSRLRSERFEGLTGDRTVGGRSDSVYLVTDQGDYFAEELRTGRETPVPSRDLAPIVALVRAGGSDRLLVEYRDDLYIGLFPLHGLETLKAGGITVMLVADRDLLQKEYRLGVIAEALGLGFVAVFLFATAGTLWHVRRISAARDELAVAMKAAEAANRSKGAFLANMSHEIRTPMAAILGYAEVLRDESVAAATRAEAVETIERNGEHLLSIINDVLDLSKLESGKMTVEQLPCDPIRLANEVAAMLLFKVEAKGIQVTVERTTAIPQSIISDPTRLRQILLNLVGNAVKFTDAGGVRILISFRRGGADHEHRLVYRVIDTGIGMSDSQIRSVFEPFRQADVSTTRRYGGTGLGLAISRRLTELIGGDLDVESRRGEGTTFTLTIPTGPIDHVAMIDPTTDAVIERTPDSSETTDLRIDARILLAEDGPDNQRLISFVLERAGATVDIAADGEEACAMAARAVERGRPYDVILMDMQMPVMDGYEASRSLRRSGYGGSIVALTAHAMSGDRQRCLDAGCDEYATKPIARERLIALIHRTMTARSD